MSVTRVITSDEGGDCGSIAIGCSSGVLGTHGVAIGYDAHACAYNVSMGAYASAQGYTGCECSASVAVGYHSSAGIGGASYGAYANSDYYGVAAGDNSQAHGDYSVAVGYGAHSFADCGSSCGYGTSIGADASSCTYGTAIGHCAHSCSYGASIGVFAFSGTNGTSIGASASSGNCGVAVGYGAHARPKAVSIGFDTGYYDTSHTKTIDGVDIRAGDLYKYGIAIGEIMDACDCGLGTKVIFRLGEGPGSSNRMVELDASEFEKRLVGVSGCSLPSDINCAVRLLWGVMGGTVV